jgi:hypothetical protein
MLRWKVRFVPLLVSAALIVAAVANAKVGSGFNFGW